MRIGSNISGLQAANQLSLSSRAIARSLERLSTGKRVNSPRDDVASFGMLTRLDSQIRGLRQANLNINVGRGLVQTAAAAIDSQREIVQQMRELALQASNSTITQAERDRINQSLLSLREQFDQITNQTEFNGIYLLNSSARDIEILTGANADDRLTMRGQSLTSSDVFQKAIGLGEFSEFTSFESDDIGTNILLEDFNNDGNLDYFKVEDDQGVVRLGDGTGGFGARLTFEVDGTYNQVSLLRAGDFNNDGIADLALAASSSGYLFLGNGDGSFNESTTFTTGGRYGELGDVNGDGNLDIITRNLSPYSFHVNYGNGDGSFYQTSTFAGESGIGDFRLADVDRDGYLDIVGVSGGSKFGAPIIEIKLNDGSGSFGASTTYALSFNGEFPSVGDIDNDGDVDIVVAGSSELNILLNNGDGTYASAITQSYSQGGPSQLVDLNGDGNLDIVSADLGASFQVAFGGGDGSFGSVQNTSISAYSSGRFDVGDVNNDGVLDVVINEGSSDTTAVFLNQTQQVAALADFNTASAEEAQALLNVFDGALDKLNARRAELGSLLEVLDLRLNSNFLTAENLEQAKSNAEDADFSLEIAELVRQQILQQAQIAVLTQANTQMQMVIGLLGSMER